MWLQAGSFLAYSGLHDDCRADAPVYTVLCTLHYLPPNFRQYLPNYIMSNEDIGSPSASSPSEQPHIVSLVCQAKKALQQGEQLCMDAHTLSNASAQTVVDILALDAQVRWMSEAVLDQLKVSMQRQPEVASTGTARTGSLPHK